MLFWVSYSYTHVFRIFVSAFVQHNWAFFTWKGALEIRSSLLLSMISINSLMVCLSPGYFTGCILLLLIQFKVLFGSQYPHTWCVGGLSLCLCLRDHEFSWCQVVSLDNNRRASHGVHYELQLWWNDDNVAYFFSVLYFIASVLCIVSSCQFLSL